MFSRRHRDKDIEQRTTTSFHHLFAGFFALSFVPLRYKSPHPKAVWPLCANVLDPVRSSIVCCGAGHFPTEFYNMHLYTCLAPRKFPPYILLIFRTTLLCAKSDGCRSYNRGANVVYPARERNLPTGLQQRNNIVCISIVLPFRLLV